MNPFLEYRNFPAPGYYVNTGKLKAAMMIYLLTLAWVKLNRLFVALRSEISRQWKGPLK